MTLKIEDESKPLLQNANGNSSSPVQNYQSGEPADLANSEDEAIQNNKHTICCNVCSNVIDIVNRQEMAVAKCPTCSEATPIREPPPGKKFIRCQCNCLLVCNISAPRIACPRTNCRRIINLTPTASSRQVPSIPGMARVVCAHCRDTFLFNTLRNIAARCPHCRRMSSVGPEFGRAISYWYLAAFILFLIIGISVVSTTYSDAAENSGFIVGYVVLFGISFFLLARFIYYFTIKVSFISESV